MRKYKDYGFLEYWFMWLTYGTKNRAMVREMRKIMAERNDR